MRAALMGLPRSMSSRARCRSASACVGAGRERAPSRRGRGRRAARAGSRRGGGSRAGSGLVPRTPPHGPRPPPAAFGRPGCVCRRSPPPRTPAGANGVEALEDALHEALGAPNCLPVVRRDVLVLLAPLQERQRRQRPFGTYLLSSKKEKKKEKENEGEKVRLLERRRIRRERGRQHHQPINQPISQSNQPINHGSCVFTHGWCVDLVSSVTRNFFLCVNRL